jgi:hypothetical protein
MFDLKDNAVARQSTRFGNVRRRPACNAEDRKSVNSPASRAIDQALINGA